MSVKTIKHSGYEWIDVFNPEEKELHEIAEKCSLNFYNLADSLEPLSLIHI